MNKKNIIKKLSYLFLSLIFFSSFSFANPYQKQIFIPCEVKECNPSLGETKTVWFKQQKGDNRRPALIWYSGGNGSYTNVDYQPIVFLKEHFDIIMVASPIPIIINKSTKGYPANAYNEYVMYRMKQAVEYYKKLLNKPIWLGGNSSGGPRMIGAISGNEKERSSDNYAGLIFASAYLAKVHQGQAEMNISLYKIKYKMNLPILIIQHERDHKPAQHPRLQKRFQKLLAEKNSNKTELILLTEGDPKITTYDGDGSHHWFSTNKEEVARVVSKFILDNTILK